MLYVDDLLVYGLIIVVAILIPGALTIMNFRNLCCQRQKAVNILETSSEVAVFDRYKGRVPYIKPSTGLEHNYLPDFIVEMTDGTKKVIEVKAKWQLSEVETKSKLEQAKKYFNEKKIQFEIWDESVLGKLNDDWHNKFEIVKVEHYKYTGKVYDIQYRRRA